VADSVADYAFCASGCQMLILRVSGIRNRLSTKRGSETLLALKLEIAGVFERGLVCSQRALLQCFPERIFKVRALDDR
jgi:hypothetical protein